MKRKQLYSLDLFSGAGGTSLGLDRAGFFSLGGAEKDKVASLTYQSNFGPPALPELAKASRDIRRLSPRIVKKEIWQLGIPRLDLLVATPPCQGFSSVGRGKLLSLKDGKCYSKDSRNNLYSYFLRFVDELKPKCILFENVPGMLNIRGVNIAETVCDEIKARGYDVKAALLNASWYGVPQSRERIILIAFDNTLGVDPKLPIITHDTSTAGGHKSQASHLGFNWRNPDYFVPEAQIKKRVNLLPAVDVQAALKDLPDFVYHLDALYSGMPFRSSRDFFDEDEYLDNIPPNDYCRMMRSWPSYDSKKVVDHFCRWNSRDFETFRRMPHGAKYPEALELAKQRWMEIKARKLKKDKLARKKDVVPPYNEKNFHERWRKLYPDRLAWTVTAHLEKDSYTHIHFDSDQSRTITLREAARLQSFPDGFRFTGSMGDMFRQIGNAVPPIMAYKIGLSIKKQLLRHQSKSTGQSCRPKPPARNLSLI